MLRWLRALYLPPHHRMVRGASDHPIQHARRMVGMIREHRGAPGVLCDVGSGLEPSRVRDLWPGRWVALDLVAGPGLDLVADGQALPFRDKGVDAILLVQVLEHVPDPLRLLRECARALVPGGHLCLTAPQYHITHDHPRDFYRYTRQGLEHLCGEAGLRVRDAWATGGPVLVVFHAIELNLPQKLRVAFVALTYRLFDWLDGWTTGHGNRAGAHDAVGWAVVATRE